MEADRQHWEVTTTEWRQTDSIFGSLRFPFSCDDYLGSFQRGNRMLSLLCSSWNSSKVRKTNWGSFCPSLRSLTT